MVHNECNIPKITEFLKNAGKYSTEIELHINRLKESLNSLEKLTTNAITSTERATFTRKIFELGNDDDIIKFLSDFHDNEESILKFVREIDIGAWKIVSDLPVGKSWVRQNVDILKKFDGLTSAQKTRLKEVYKNFKLPPNAPSSPPFKMTVNFNGKSIEVKFNKYGFPEFDKVTTKMTGLNGENLMQSYPGAWNHKNVPKDLRQASNWALEHFPEGRVRRSTTSGGKKSYEKIDLLDDDGNWVTQTWYHHENGQDLFPVPSKIHNFPEGGLDHSGGNVIKNGSTSLEGVFDYRPIFE